ncbi:hypothetical protein SLE2022_007530 [Rubroshorea leprosula]
MSTKRKSAPSAESASFRRQTRSTSKLKKHGSEAAEVAPSTFLNEEMADAEEICSSQVEMVEEKVDVMIQREVGSKTLQSKSKARGKTADVDEEDGDVPDARFIGDPVPDEEARERWPKRYEGKVSVS